MSEKTTNRRRYLMGIGAVGLTGIAGCNAFLFNEEDNRDETNVPEDVSEEQIFEVISTTADATCTYQFTIDGTVSEASADGNSGDVGNDGPFADTITENGDGTVTVEGRTGNGEGDVFLIRGPIESFRKLRGDSDLRLELDDVDVTGEFIDRRLDEGRISVTTGNASPVEESPRFVTFNGRVEGVPAETTVTVGFEFSDYNEMWRQTETKEIIDQEATEFSITEKMPYINRIFPYRAFVRADGQTSKQTGETRDVRVPDFIDTVEVETVDVSVSGTSVTVTGRVTDFGKATTLRGGVELSDVEDQGVLSHTAQSDAPKLSANGIREFSMDLSELDPVKRYQAQAKAMIAEGPVSTSSLGDPVQFQTGALSSSAPPR